MKVESVEYNGQVIVDSEEYEAERGVKVSVAEDSIYVLAQKRF